jgi:hypothetical protein
MTTGNDHVLVCSGPIEYKVAGFLDLWALRWPDMIVEIEGAGEPRAWAAQRADDLRDTAEIYLVRDPDMDDHWERYGYTLDDRREGPICLMYRRFQASAISVRALEDPYGPGVGRFAPYDLRVVGQGLYLVTVVLPDGEGSFGHEVLSELEAALSADGRH